LKVREVEHPTLGKQVQFWCAGCGQFHEAPRENWNGDQEKPTLSEHVITGQTCRVLMSAGVLHYDYECTHRLKGKSQPMQTEESWRPHGIPWDAKLTEPPKVLP
jgi:hypothetical protein